MQFYKYSTTTHKTLYILSSLVLHQCHLCRASQVIPALLFVPETSGTPCIPITTSTPLLIMRHAKGHSVLTISPGDPGNPCFPGSPGGPIRPGGPLSPDCPCLPGGPCTPSVPAGPTGQVTSHCGCWGLARGCGVRDERLREEMSVCSHRQFVTSLPGHAVRVARHHHPLQVNGLGPLTVRLLGDHDLPVEINPAVHHLQWLLPHGLAVDVEDHLISPHSEVELVPLTVENLPKSRVGNYTYYMLETSSFSQVRVCRSPL